MNKHRKRWRISSGPISWWLTIIGLGALQVAGMFNAPFWQWFGGARPNSLFVIFCFVGGILYVVAAWLVWTCFVIDLCEHAVRTQDIPDFGKVAVLPLLFYALVLFWPVVLLIVLYAERRRPENR